MKNRLYTLVLMLAGMVWIAGCSEKSQPAETAPAAASAEAGVMLTPAQRQNIQTALVRRVSFHKTIEITRIVGFDNDQATTILAPISGPVSKLLVALGESVTNGQPLAAIDSPDYAAAISSYRKALTTAKNTRRIADVDEQLFKGDAIARRDLEQAQADALNAEADRDAGLLQLRSLGVDQKSIEEIEKNRPVGKTQGTIRSPLAGTVVEKLITPGQLLQAGTTPCFTVANMSRVWVMANVFESDLALLKVGDTAEVSTPAFPRAYAGAIDNIAAIIDPATQAIGVRVLTTNMDGMLKKQMYVHVAIQSARESSGLFVPVAAILRNDENLPFVYLTKSNGAFERRRVGLGARVGTDYEITSGLQEGESVIADGGLFVQFLQNQ